MKHRTVAFWLVFGGVIVVPEFASAHGNGVDDAGYRHCHDPNTGKVIYERGQGIRDLDHLEGDCPDAPSAPPQS